MPESYNQGLYPGVTEKFIEVTTRDLHFSQAADQAFKAFGFANGNPWNTSVQYKRNILDRDTFQSGGFKATYRFKVNEAFDYGSMRLVAERPQLFKVKINGTEVKPIPGEWWLDRSFGVYDIARWVRNGTNELEVRVIGSHKNLLGPHYREEKGLASPWHWKHIKSRIPAADYLMLDYGLMEDFDLIQ